MAPRTSTLSSRLLPFSPSTTPVQAATYLLGISLFSISFLVFLNSAVSFVITDLIGVKTGVGDIVGTLGFVDEIVALIACPFWGLLSDRLGVRWVAVLGYAIIAVSLVIFVQARDVYPSLVLARIAFAIGATAAATMVTAILPVLTDDGEDKDHAGRDGEADQDGGVLAAHEEDHSSETNEAGNGRSTMLGANSNVSGSGSESENGAGGKPPSHNPRGSIAVSFESDATITQETYSSLHSGAVHAQDFASQPRGQGSQAADSLSSLAHRGDSHDGSSIADAKARKPSTLAGYVGLFTGCGALVALVLFLPLPAQFSKKEGVTPAEAITDSFYVVAAVAVVVAIFVFLGLRGLRGEEEKGWRMLLGPKHNKPQQSQQRHNGENDTHVPDIEREETAAKHRAPRVLPYHHLLLSSLRLGVTDPHIALGYLGGFVARASTVAISLFVPLYVNEYFMSQGFCQGSPHDPSPDLKRECRAAYVLASALSGVAQLIALLCAPVFGYVSARRYSLLSCFSRGAAGGGGGGVNLGVAVAASLGVVGYCVFPALKSPEFKDVDGRGGSASVFLVVALLGISQIGAIVCSLGSLGRGVLGEDVVVRGFANEADEGEGSQGAGEGESDALLGPATGNGARRERRKKISRVHLKGSIAGVYSWCGGAAILLLTKLGGYLFDVLSTGAPFYMMAVFNAVLLIASLGVDLRGSRIWSR
ncbi:hypothetical protein F5Y16DRAFT_297197 [Xylariaceae sp. FL0255]|nr:hypothetical protein F5Y16DRAFT_297197 [Xylariaceae sp. FL0255]